MYLLNSLLLIILSISLAVLPAGRSETVEVKEEPTNQAHIAREPIPLSMLNDKGWPLADTTQQSSVYFVSRSELSTGLYSKR